MIRFAAEEYQECKKWIAKKIQGGYSWADVKKLCTTDEMFEEVKAFAEFVKQKYKKK